jgi:hypothetical protein
MLPYPENSAMIWAAQAQRRPTWAGRKPHSNNQNGSQCFTLDVKPSSFFTPAPVNAVERGSRVARISKKSSDEGAFAI